MKVAQILSILAFTINQSDAAKLRNALKDGWDDSYTAVAMNEGIDEKQ